MIRIRLPASSGIASRLAARAGAAGGWLALLRSSRAASAIESNSCAELLAIGRLFGHLRRADRQRMRGLLGAGNDMDRNVGGVGVVAQQVEQHEAVDVATGQGRA